VGGARLLGVEGEAGGGVYQVRVGHAVRRIGGRS
jgi:hypothetical protein